jgi:hypothetical protein
MLVINGRNTQPAQLGCALSQANAVDMHEVLKSFCWHLSRSSDEYGIELFAGALSKENDYETCADLRIMLETLAEAASDREQELLEED